VNSHSALHPYAYANSPKQMGSKLHRELQKLVSWSLTSLFSTNMAISETKGQGWSAIPIQIGNHNGSCAVGARCDQVP